jgi:hypothetical protein
MERLGQPTSILLRQHQDETTGLVSKAMDASKEYVAQSKIGLLQLLQAVASLNSPEVLC